MKNILVYYLLLFSAFIISSCSTSRDFGSLHERFSSDRIDHFRKETPKRIYNSKRNYAAKSRTKDLSPTHAADHTGKKNSGYASAKVMYHSERNNVLREANKYQGIPYVYGGKNPERGFDCSGFVTYVYSNQGIMLKGNAQSLSNLGRKKHASELVKGDLVFFGDGNKVTHVGIVTLNDGENLSMIHSSSTGGIRSDNITHSDYWRPKMMHGSDIIAAFLEEEM